MTVRFRIVGTFIVLASALLMWLGLFVPYRLAEEHAQQLRVSATGLMVLLRPQVEGAGDDHDELTKIFANASSVADVAYVDFVDHRGTVTVHAGAAPAVMASLPSRGHASHQDDHHVILQDVVTRGAEEGVLRVAMTREGFTHTKENFRTAIILAALVIVLLSALCALVLSRLVVRPIEQLTRGVRALEKGEVDNIRVAGKTGDELHDLAEAINRMRADLEASSAEVAKTAKKARVRADKLERANVELDRFAYAASHDLRAPLRGIAYLSEFISEDIRGASDVSEDVRDNLELLLRRVQRLDNLLMSLLEYSRVGRDSLSPDDVDVFALVTDVVDLLALPQGFEVKIDPDLPVIETSRAPLERVFVHLIGNAVKHHDKKTGLIEVGYAATPRFAVFTVSDDGPGIPPELQEKAFKIFSTLKRRDEVEGSGMGLALIKKIVESLGGELNVESEGRGCRFIVRWPMEFEEEDHTMISLRSTSRRAQ